MGLPSTVGDPTEAINSIPADVWTALAEKREAAVKLLRTKLKMEFLYIWLFH